MVEERKDEEEKDGEGLRGGCRLKWMEGGGIYR